MSMGSGGLRSLRIIRGVNLPNVGMVYVACHTYHMGGTMDHRRSHGLRYITNRREVRPGCTSTSRLATATSP